MPSGLQPSLEILGFTLFMFVIGNIGVAPLAATSIAFNLNTIVFLPAVGLGYGVSTLVTRSLGMHRPALADRAIKSGLVISQIYMIICSSALSPDPGPASRALRRGRRPFLVFAEVSAIATILLRFVALFDFRHGERDCAGGLRGRGEVALSR